MFNSYSGEVMLRLLDGYTEEVSTGAQATVPNVTKCVTDAISRLRKERQLAADYPVTVDFIIRKDNKILTAGSRTVTNQSFNL